MAGWWSWILTIGGCLGLWAAGSGRRWGWGVCLATQALWLAYAVATDQGGFIIGAIVYGAVYLRNWRSQ